MAKLRATKPAKPGRAAASTPPKPPATAAVKATAKAKRTAKGCDWILANDVSPATGIMGGDKNTVHLITAGGTEDWPELDKSEVGTRLAARIADALKGAA